VARVVEGKHVNAAVNAMIVPGSGLVKEQAEAEGLDKIFKAAGFDWREPGCSMCLAMNPAPIWCRRRWRLPRRSPVTSSTCASGADAAVSVKRKGPAHPPGLLHSNRADHHQPPRPNTTVFGRL
jgi:hypothetical protein